MGCNGDCLCTHCVILNVSYKKLDKDDDEYFFPILNKKSYKITQFKLTGTLKSDTENCKKNEGIDVSINRSPKQERLKQSHVK